MKPTMVMPSARCFSSMNRILPLVAAAAATCFSVPSAAQMRYVVVNGQELHPLQVTRIERLFCSPIANGRYWYDPDTGIWGYEGNPLPQGQFINRCASNGGRTSLSQRGLLYSMSEILSGR
jgi:hypothetical protein